MHQKQMTSVLHISLGFYSPSWSASVSRGEGHSPMRWWGGAARMPEKPSSRGAALQASFTHAGMHFPPIPPPLAALQTAGPTAPHNVVALGSARPPRVPSPTHGPFQYQEWDASFKKPPISVGYSLCLPVCELLLRLCTSVSLQRKEGKTLGILPACTSDGRKREWESLAWELMDDFWVSPPNISPFRGVNVN